jgi:hypothetical protein
MTAALATRARRQEALDGRWLLEPVLLVGGCRRPAVGWTGLAELAVEVLTLDRLGLTRSTGHVAGPTQSHATRLTRSAG